MEVSMISIVGAGPGAPDLITVRGAERLRAADTVIYAGSLVNPALLGLCSGHSFIYNSAEMTLEEVMKIMRRDHAAGRNIVRLHTGDPSIFGAVREQIDILKNENISFELIPGVSSFCGAAASLQAEYTLPGVSQTVIITRLAGRTPVPERENLASLAAHGATMAVFLSAGMLAEVSEALLRGAYTEATPAAIVYKATWPEEKIVHCTVGTLEEAGKTNGISRTALILVGDFLGGSYERSCLYDPGFATGYRKVQR